MYWKVGNPSVPTKDFKYDYEQELKALEAV